MGWPDISDTEREERLERARARCFWFDLPDAGARLCRANMPYGIAKIHWVQEEAGFEPDACWISTPDSTVTRNLDRWASGFGYGGAIEWGGDLVPLELKPNCCGMIVVGLETVPPLSELEATIAHLAETPIEVGLVQAHWDMHRGNHFINLYEVEDPEVTSGYPHVAIMHSSGSELRGPNALGPGLYLGRGRKQGGLDELARTIRTPFGLAFVLTGESAEMYFEYVALVSRFARRRRAAYAWHIFGDDAEILFNEMHQGFDRRGSMLLGCYRARGDGALPWVPVTLQPTLPAYLVTPGEIYSRSTLASEGVLERAEHEGLADRLVGAGLLPHGGGYAYPEADDAEVEVMDQGPSRRRRFRVTDHTDWFEQVRELDFAYRGEEVIRRLKDLGAGTVATRLRPVARLQG